MGSSSFATVSAGADDGRSVDASAIGLCGGVLGEVGLCSGCASICASPWSIVAEVSLKGGSSCLLTFPGPPLGEAWFTGKLCSLLPFSISSTVSAIGAFGAKAIIRISVISNALLPSAAKGKSFLPCNAI